MRTLLVLAISFLSVSCSSLQTARPAWVGVYEVLDKTIVEDRNSPTLVSLAGTKVGEIRIKRAEETMSLRPQVGYGFGLEFVASREAQDGLTAVIHLPAPGLLDQRTGEHITRSEWPPNCVETTCFAIYNFEHASEFLPGAWRLEIWRKGVKLSEHVFTLAGSR
jgi:hypothetical protein